MDRVRSSLPRGRSRKFFFHLACCHESRLHTYMCLVFLLRCMNCRQRRSYCSKEKPTCSRCRDSRLTCIYEGARKILVNESYLRELEAKAKALDSKLNSLYPFKRLLEVLNSLMQVCSLAVRPLRIATEIMTKMTISRMSSHFWSHLLSSAWTMSLRVSLTSATPGNDIGF